MSCIFKGIIDFNVVSFFLAQYTHDEQYSFNFVLNYCIFLETKPEYFAAPFDTEI